MLPVSHADAPTATRPLSGDKFWEGFTQKSVTDLLTFVSKNMPNGQGGTLSAATYNDLVALILKSNGFPAGTTELAPETHHERPDHSQGRSGRTAGQYARSNRRAAWLPRAAVTGR